MRRAILSGVLAFSGFVATLVPAPAMASILDTFICDAGDISHSVTILPDEKRVELTTSVGEMVDPSLAGTRSLAEVPVASGFAYEGEGLRFFGKEAEGFLQEGGYDPIACELVLAENEMPEQEASANNASQGEGPLLNTPGRTFGGNYREGPGQEFAKLGSLREGTPVTLILNTGVAQDGYDWYRVRLSTGVAVYMWGALLCAEAMTPTGTNGDCRQYFR